QKLPHALIALCKSKIRPPVVVPGHVFTIHRTSNILDPVGVGIGHLHMLQCSTAAYRNKRQAVYLLIACVSATSVMYLHILQTPGAVIIHKRSGMAAGISRAAPVQGDFSAAHIVGSLTKDGNA